MQAVILAAGMGKRLKDLTSDNTKCMVRVNGVTMVERMLSQLDSLKLSKIVIVIGYEGHKLVDFINTLDIKTNIEYVENAIYYKTNNIYSLYLAKDYLLEEDTLLLESDLIFEDSILEKIINHPYPNLAVVDKFESWMDGTVVTLDGDDNIKRFIPNKQFSFEEIPEYYKTVNIYKFSKEFSSSHYVPFLEAYSKALGNNEYYEQVLRVITLLDKPEIKAIRLDNDLWYEIDDVQDLDIAESIFASKEEQLSKIQSRYGGYWRYPHLIDFCYLVNPFFPSQKLVDEMKANFERLLFNYPSGQRVNSLLGAKYFGIKQEHVCVGNGAAELIKSLMTKLKGNIGMIYPTFEEYPNRREKASIVPYYPNNNSFQYNADELIEFYKDKDISVLTIINPDNPSGNFIKRADVLRLVKWSKERNITIIIDESFVDFAETGEENSLLEEELLCEYKNLIVVKSISKSFGVPGIRLGVIASGDVEIISYIKKDVAIWNINSFGEFYMQIFEKYKSDYKLGLEKFMAVRKEFANKLDEIKGIRVIPSQANYIMCEVLAYKAYDLTKELLTEHNILIKDLSTKKGFNNGQYIRVAVKTAKENDLLVKAIKSILQ